MPLHHRLMTEVALRPVPTRESGLLERAVPRRQQERILGAVRRVYAPDAEHAEVVDEPSNLPPAVPLGERIIRTASVVAAGGGGRGYGLVPRGEKDKGLLESH